VEGREKREKKKAPGRAFSTTTISKMQYEMERIERAFRGVFS